MAGTGACSTSGGWTLCPGCWQDYRKYRTATGAGRSFHVPLMFPQDGFADAQTQARATPRAFRRIKRIEDVGQDFGWNARSVVLKDHSDRLLSLFQPDAQSAAVAYFPHGLLGVQDQVQENLHQLMGVGVYGRKRTFPQKIYGDVALAQGVRMQVQCPLHQFTEINRRSAGCGWPGEIHQVLHDLDGASGLLLQDFQLLASAIGDLPVLQQLAHSQNAGQRIVQLVSKSSNHLAHGSQALALNDLLLKLLFDGNVTHRENHAAHFAIRVKQGTCRSAHGSPASVAVTATAFAGPERLSARH